MGDKPFVARVWALADEMNPNTIEAKCLVSLSDAKFKKQLTRKLTRKQAEDITNGIPNPRLDQWSGFKSKGSEVEGQWSRVRGYG
jgi:hypothetical protein